MEGQKCRPEFAPGDSLGDYVLIDRPQRIAGQLICGDRSPVASLRTPLQVLSTTERSNRSSEERTIHFGEINSRPMRVSMCEEMQILPQAGVSM